MLLPLLCSSSVLICEEPLVQEHCIHWSNVWLRQQLSADIQKALRSIPFLCQTIERQTLVHTKHIGTLGGEVHRPVCMRRSITLRKYGASIS